MNKHSLPITQPGLTASRAASPARSRPFPLQTSPRAGNTAVAHLLDGGQTVTAVITRLRDESNPRRRMAVDLYLEPRP